MRSANERRRILAGDPPPWIEKHPRRDYVIAQALSTPDWVDRKALALLYREARRRTRRDGCLWVVDHIVPLTHPHVCGLTVPWNLRVITGPENAARSNRWWEWTADLFEFPEQLRLLL